MLCAKDILGSKRLAVKTYENNNFIRPRMTVETPDKINLKMKNQLSERRALNFLLNCRYIVYIRKLLFLWYGITDFWLSWHSFIFLALPCHTTWVHLSLQDSEFHLFILPPSSP